MAWAGSLVMGEGNATGETARDGFHGLTVSGGVYRRLSCHVHHYMVIASVIIVYSFV